MCNEDDTKWSLFCALLGETCTSVIMIEVVGEILAGNKKPRYF